MFFQTNIEQNFYTTTKNTGARDKAKHAVKTHNLISRIHKETTTKKKV